MEQSHGEHRMTQSHQMSGKATESKDRLHKEVEL